MFPPSLLKCYTGYDLTPQDLATESFIVRPPSFGECTTWDLNYSMNTRVGRNDEEWFLYSYEKQDWMFLLKVELNSCVFAELRNIACYKKVPTRAAILDPSLRHTM